MPTLATNAETALHDVAREAAGCQRCPLYTIGTQTVFGQGPATAPVVLVGEQPGDVEDRKGLPFVGPAGSMLDRALAMAGLRRARMYVTTAVKHFTHVTVGKRRLHQKPNVYEIDRCRWWLDLELEIIEPELTVAMGTTAARALCGRPVKITETRGQTLHTARGGQMLVTIHPSALLRLRDSGDRQAELDRFVADLRQIGMMVPAVRL